MLLRSLVLALTALALFVLVAHAVVSGAWQGVDGAVLRWLNAHSSPWLHALALLGTVLGTGAATWVVLLISTGFLCWSRRPALLALLWVSALGGRSLSRALKGIFDRPRPRLWPWELEVLGREIHFPTSASFPSGHAVTAVVVYGMLAYVLLRIGPTRSQRRLTLAGAGLLIVTIGFSRLYLGVHYPTDVLGGYLVGMGWAATCVLALELLRRG